MKKRLLVVHTGGVGDFICTFPTLSELARCYTIEVAGIPDRAALAQAAGLAAKVHDLDGTGFPSLFSEPNDRLRAFATNFDEALVWMADDDGLIARRLMHAGIPVVRCFPGIPPADWGDHAAQWYASCADTAITLPFATTFSPSSHENRPSDVILHPGSGSRTKNWPLDRFASLADQLATRGHRVRWCTGPAEAAAPPGADSIPPMSLVSLAGVLAGARLFVGNDSGISHLAGVAGCATLAIFGPTNPTVWRPAGPRVRTLGGEGLWPEPEDVCRAARQLLDDA